VAEESELRHRLDEELELLTAYQSKMCLQAEAERQREKRILGEKVSLRRAKLIQHVRRCDSVLYFSIFFVSDLFGNI